MRNHAIAFALATTLLTGLISLTSGLPFLSAFVFASAISLITLGLHQNNFAIRVPLAVGVRERRAGVDAPVHRRQVVTVRKVPSVMTRQGVTVRKVPSVMTHAAPTRPQQPHGTNRRGASNVAHRRVMLTSPHGSTHRPPRTTHLNRR